MHWCGTDKCSIHCVIINIHHKEAFIKAIGSDLPWKDWKGASLNKSNIGHVSTPTLGKLLTGMKCATNIWFFFMGSDTILNWTKHRPCCRGSAVNIFFYCCTWALSLLLENISYLVYIHDILAINEGVDEVSTDLCVTKNQELQHHSQHLILPAAWTPEKWDDVNNKIIHPQQLAVW